jgi:hypothetical protein
MKKKIGFGAAIALFAVVLLSTRFYMVDLPVWHISGGGDGPDPGLSICAENSSKAIWG